MATKSKALISAEAAIRELNNANQRLNGRNSVALEYLNLYTNSYDTQGVQGGLIELVVDTLEGSRD